MAKKYVIEEAFLNCQYGACPSKLAPRYDRHISAGGRLMANESDIDTECYSGNFGSCRSPYICSIAVEGRDVLSHSQQIAACGGVPCSVEVCVPWQNTKKDVHLGREGYQALLEDGWTICSKGLGIISVITSGQEDEDDVQTMLERMEQLENIVNEYMKANGIKEKCKEGLLESVLLWNGYNAEDMFWDYESNEENRAFCAYLEKENPNLFHYFERGIYIQDNEGEIIDLSYMMGINKALNNKKDAWSCVSRTMTEDRGMYNGYLEACRQEGGKGTAECLKDFLDYCSGGDYDGYGRYKEYADKPMQSIMYDNNPYYSQDMTEEEKNREILFNAISGRIQMQMYSDKESRGEIAQDKTAQAEEITRNFLDILWEDLRKGE